MLENNTVQSGVNWGILEHFQSSIKTNNGTLTFAVSSPVNQCLMQPCHSYFGVFLSDQTTRSLRKTETHVMENFCHFFTVTSRVTAVIINTSVLHKQWNQMHSLSRVCVCNFSINNSADRALIIVPVVNPDEVYLPDVEEGGKWIYAF